MLLTELFNTLTALLFFNNITHDEIVNCTIFTFVYTCVYTNMTKRSFFQIFFCFLLSLKIRLLLLLFLYFLTRYFVELTDDSALNDSFEKLLLQSDNEHDFDFREEIQQNDSDQFDSEDTSDSDDDASGEI